MKQRSVNEKTLVLNSSMKKLFIHILLALTFFITGHASAWTIEAFNLEADIQTDGTVAITETIKADFTGQLQKHGIFRDIPVQFMDENNKKFKTPISNIEITDANNHAISFSKSRVGSNVSLKIGNANKYVKQSETYIIKYNISGVLNAFKEHDEFYWNVTGNEWKVPIKHATAIVTLPEKSKFLKAKCFTGKTDSTAQNCEFKLNESSSAAGFKTNQNLKQGEDFTIVFGWEKGLVRLPQRQMAFDYEGWAKKLQYLFLLFPLWGIARNLRIRNELKPHKAVIPLYHPPENLGVGLIGFFERGKPHTRDLTALLTQLCVKGLLSIKEIKPTGVFKKASYEFTALPSNNAKLDKEEQFVYDHLLIAPGETISLKALTKKDSIFKYSNYQQLLNQIKKEVSHYFRASKIKPLKFLGSVFLFSSIFFGAIIFSVLAKSALPILFFITGAVATFALPQFDKKGQLLKHDIRGYKLFLNTADKERINWSEAQNIFEGNLPYAIALNMTDKWAKVFDDKIQPPEWFEGQNISNLSSLERGITRSASRAIVSSAPRSTSSSRGSSGFSRGGRSGGGFGGGGGGSW